MVRGLLAARADARGSGELGEVLNGMKLLLFQVKETIDREDEAMQVLSTITKLVPMHDYISESHIDSIICAQGELHATSGELRAVYCRTAAAVLCIDADFLTDDDIEELRASSLACLGDRSYVARRGAIAAIPDLFEASADSQVRPELSFSECRFCSPYLADPKQYCTLSSAL